MSNFSPESHFTVAGSRWSRKQLFPVSRAAIADMSKSSSENENTSKFSAILSLLTDLGIVPPLDEPS